MITRGQIKLHKEKIIEHRNTYLKPVRADIKEFTKQLQIYCKKQDKLNEDTTRYHLKSRACKRMLEKQNMTDFHVNFIKHLLKIALEKNREYMQVKWLYEEIIDEVEDWYKEAML